MIRYCENGITTGVKLSMNALRAIAISISNLVSLRDDKVLDHQLENSTTTSGMGAHSAGGGTATITASNDGTIRLRTLLSSSQL
jgi:hypothetical protein